MLWPENDVTQVKEDLPGAGNCYRAAIEADPEDKDAARRLAKVGDKKSVFAVSSNFDDVSVCRGGRQWLSARCW